MVGEEYGWMVYDGGGVVVTGDKIKWPLITMMVIL